MLANSVANLIELNIRQKCLDEIYGVLFNLFNQNVKLSQQHSLILELRLLCAVSNKPDYLNKFLMMIRSIKKQFEEPFSKEQMEKIVASGNLPISYEAFLEPPNKKTKFDGSNKRMDAILSLLHSKEQLKNEGYPCLDGSTQAVQQLTSEEEKAEIEIRRIKSPHVCSRCKKTFKYNFQTEPNHSNLLTLELNQQSDLCTYHSGKLEKTSSTNKNRFWTCCGADPTKRKASISVSFQA